MIRTSIRRAVVRHPGLGKPERHVLVDQSADAFRSDLEKDEIVLATEVTRHFRKRFPIDAFVVDAEAAPRRFVLEDLKEQWRDSRTRFPRTRVR